jgi:hypothetical protein
MACRCGFNVIKSCSNGCNGAGLQLAHARLLNHLTYMITIQSNKYENTTLLEVRLALRAKSRMVDAIVTVMM